MTAIELAILDYVYSRMRTDNKFDKRLQGAIIKRLVYGDWSTFKVKRDKTLGIPILVDRQSTEKELIGKMIEGQRKCLNEMKFKYDKSE